MSKFSPFNDRSETVTMLTGSDVALVFAIELVTSRSVPDKEGMNTRKIDRYRQGINVKNLEYYFKSNLFRMPGNKFSSQNLTGKDPHELDERDFGQPKLFDSIQPFIDIPGRLDTGSVEFIKDPDVQQYPQIYFNLLLKDPDQMDGVIEPLAIREVIANRSIEAPFIAHSIKADLEAGNNESYKGADRVFQQIPLTASLQVDPFIDGDSIVITGHGVNRFSTSISGYDLTKRFRSSVYTYGSFPSLQGWWKLSTDVSSAGDVVDSSGNGRTGTFDAADNRPAESTDTPSTYIQTATCTFDGEDNGVNIGTAATWDAIIGNNTANGSTQKMTFSAWVYKTGDGGSDLGRIIDFGEGDIMIYTNTNESVYMGIKWTDVGGAGNNGTAYWHTGDNPFALNTWTHIAATYDATSVDNDPIIYINGKSKALTEGAAPAGSYYGIVSQAGYIGNRSSDNRGFEGQLCDATVWNTILDDENILALYNATSGPYNELYEKWSLAGPGFTSDIVRIINPFDDSRPLSEKLFSFSSFGSGSLTGSLSERGLVDYLQKSATAGFVYDNVTEQGTDSLAYGGLLK